jgi:hypothetical protein
MPALCFIVFGALMYRRYVAALAEVERVNASLAERLKAREAELEASHRKLRAIEMRQTISDERQRLMQDMHDGLGSSLISAIRSVERGDLGDARVSQILKDCLDDLKLTIDSMEPVDADLLLLLATLRFRLEPRLEGTGVNLNWEVREMPTLSWLNPSSALYILRIVQESIANILRHTRATGIHVSTAVARRRRVHPYRRQRPGLRSGGRARPGRRARAAKPAAPCGRAGGQGTVGVRAAGHGVHALAAAGARRRAALARCGLNRKPANCSRRAARAAACPYRRIRALRQTEARRWIGLTFWACLEGGRVCLRKASGDASWTDSKGVACAATSALKHRDAPTGSASATASTAANTMARFFMRRPCFRRMR